MPIPKALAEKGIRDMVRISDARMSGTAFGTVVLHTAPESQVGGPLSLVQTGDRIRMDVEKGILDLLVSEEELNRRRKGWKPEESRYHRGYAKLYVDHVLQANQGADMDFLLGKDTRPVLRESH